MTTTTTERNAAAGRRYSHRHAVRVYQTEARQEFLKLVRTLIFAVMRKLGAPNRTAAVRPGSPASVVGSETNRPEPTRTGLA